MRIGRDDAMDLCLPDGTVSREHCHIVLGTHDIRVLDQRGQNGTLVNGTPVRKAVLRSRDELRIGRYTLTFLGVGEGDRYWEGRYVGYLPAYEPMVPVEAQADTGLMCKEDLRQARERQRVIENGILVAKDATRHLWRLGTEGVAFTGRTLASWFTTGPVAEVRLRGAAHVVQASRWSSVSVNGQTVRGERVLHDGDILLIGKTPYQYACPR